LGLLDQFKIRLGEVLAHQGEGLGAAEVVIASYCSLMNLFYLARLLNSLLRIASSSGI
jgi:hypothetical protein